MWEGPSSLASEMCIRDREDWMYCYLYPSSSGPVYVLPYLDGAASGAVPVAALPSSTIPQLLRLSAQSPSIQTQDDLLSAIRPADAVQCCKAVSYTHLFRFFRQNAGTQETWACSSHTHWETIFSARMPYPRVGSLTRTWVTAPTSLPS